ncbi:MAG: ATP-binding protein [Thermodesulfobacteriota bacterium]|nr:ATP-binding protein [Thermodesulfobacteriota bacterium]
MHNAPENALPSYEELQRRLEAAEAALQAIRDGQVDTIVGDNRHLVVRLAEAEAREAHIRRVLMSIRNVNQLIVQTTDPHHLIQGACDHLTETMGYFNAWIALLDADDKTRMGMIAATGYGDGFEIMQNRLKQGQYTHCLNRALADDALVVVADPVNECPDCPLSRHYGGRVGMARRLAYLETVFGVLFVSVPKTFAEDEEAGDLFCELADDLGFALHKMDEAKALQRANEIIVRSPAVAIVWKNAEGWPVIFASENADGIFGWTARDLLSGTIVYADLIHPDDRQRVAGEVAQRSADPSAAHFEHAPYRIVTKAGDVRWIADMTHIRRDDNGAVLSYEGILLDITDQKQAEADKNRLEAQFQQSQKLESIGRLAGGVAHDLNNLLSPILGYGEMLLEDTDAEDPRREPMEEIILAGERARDLVRQLLAFSRKQVLSFRTIELNTLVTGFEKLLRRTVREDIHIHLTLADSLPPVKGDTGQIEQIIMNMAVNAQDAMPHGGMLTLETAMVELDRQYADRHEEVMPGPHVMLGISDTGIGMDEETRKHLFEPFFTTKPVGEGTGLGLATVYGIVKQHKGHVWVYSEPGRGTTFKVYLPVAAGARMAEKDVTVEDAAFKGSETILLVEDNQQLRKLARALLMRRGYSVLTAANGKEALSILEDHAAPLDLLLTDVIMPDMNGRELYFRAMEIYPELKVLYMSGYTDNVIAHHGVLDEGVQFIQKPFTVKALATKVREVLMAE